MTVSALARLKDLAATLKTSASYNRQYFAPLLSRFRHELPGIIEELEAASPASGADDLQAARSSLLASEGLVLCGPGDAS